MSKYREAPCIYYVCKGECKKGFKAEHNGKCQKCEKYMDRKGFKRVNKRREEKEKYYIKTASTRQIIEYLQAYEKIHGIGSIESIGSVCNGSRDVEYIFYIEDKNGNETGIEIPTIDKGDIWNET